MNCNPLTHALVALALLGTLAAAQAQQPESAPADEIEAPEWINDREQRMLLEGRGMGAGRVAMAAGYPGPMHVLRQADALELTDEQRAQTSALRQRVHERSREIGAEIIKAEQRLGEVLASDPVDREAMHTVLGKIADLHADRRAGHIEAHLDQAALLDAEQREKMAGMEMPSHGGRQHGERRQHRERRRMHREQRGEGDG